MIASKDIAKNNGTPATVPETPSSPSGPDIEPIEAGYTIESDSKEIAGDAMTLESVAQLEALCKQLYSGYTGEDIDIDFSCLTDIKADDGAPAVVTENSFGGVSTPTTYIPATTPAESGYKTTPKSLRFQEKPRSPNRKFANLQDDGENKPEDSGAGGGAGGLSELSKQLRGMRAKSDFQNSEIERLERQVRILSDLRGVSVGDLRTSLETACAEEAHEELQNQVIALEAQLEAMRTKNETTMRRASAASNEAANQKIATLQLRVGELEEVEQAKRKEIQKVYKRFQDQQSKATVMESTCKQQKAQLDKFQDVAKGYIKEMEKLKRERDMLREKNDALMRQLKEMEGKLKVEEDMRAIEKQIKEEQVKKAMYLQEAKEARQSTPSPVTSSSGRGERRLWGEEARESISPVTSSSGRGERRSSAVSRRISANQLAAIQNVVGRAAGNKSPKSSSRGQPSSPSRSANNAPVKRGSPFLAGSNLSSQQLSDIENAVCRAAGKPVGASHNGSTAATGPVEKSCKSLTGGQLSAIVNALKTAQENILKNGKPMTEETGKDYTAAIGAIESSIGKSRKSLTEDQLSAIVDALVAEQQKLQSEPSSPGSQGNFATRNKSEVLGAINLSPEQLASVERAICKAAEKEDGASVGSNDGTPVIGSVQKACKTLSGSQLGAIVDALRAEQRNLMRSSNGGGFATNDASGRPGKPLTDSQLTAIVGALAEEQRKYLSNPAGSASRESAVLEKMNLSPEQLAAVEHAISRVAGKQGGPDVEAELGSSVVESIGKSCNSLSGSQLSAIVGALQAKQEDLMRNGYRRKTLTDSQLTGIVDALAEEQRKHLSDPSSAGAPLRGSAVLERMNLSPQQLAEVEHAIYQVSQGGPDVDAQLGRSVVESITNSCKSLTGSQLSAIVDALKAKQGDLMRNGSAGKALTNNQLTAIVDTLAKEQQKNASSGSTGDHAVARVSEVLKSMNLSPKQLGEVEQAICQVTGKSDGGVVDAELESSVVECIANSCKTLTESQLAEVVDALRAQQEKLMRNGGGMEGVHNGNVEKSRQKLTESQLAAIVDALKAEQEKIAKSGESTSDAVAGEAADGHTRKSLSSEQFATLQNVLKKQLAAKQGLNSHTGSASEFDVDERVVDKDLAGEAIDGVMVSRSIARESPALDSASRDAIVEAKNEIKAKDMKIERLYNELRQQAAKATELEALVSARDSSVDEVKLDEIKAKDIKIDRLYNELRQQAAKATELEALVSEQKVQIERNLERTKEESENLKHVKTNYDWAVSEHDNLYKKFCDLELELTLEKDKATSLMNQLAARDNEYNLRSDQYDCRFKVQNDRIVDLEQQQASLYAAFELLREEVSAQDKEHSELKSSLDEADSEVARQLDGEQKRQSVSESAARANSPVDGQSSSGRSSSSPRSVVSPEMRSSSRNVIDQPSTVNGDVLMKGFLWKLDKIKGWKRRFFTLYCQRGVYNLSYSDGPRERIKGVYEFITPGVSTIAETQRIVKKPFAFALNPDPRNPNSLVLQAAAMNASDFQGWMVALKMATEIPVQYGQQRPEQYPYPANLTPEYDNNAEGQAQSDHTMALQLQRGSASLV